MCETQHFYKVKLIRDPRVPSSHYNAMHDPLRAAAIDRELAKFEKNLCLQIVPYNGQHRVPMMWTLPSKPTAPRKLDLSVGET